MNRIRQWSTAGLCIAGILFLIVTTSAAQSIDFVFFQPNASFKDNKEAITAIRSLEKYLSRSVGGSVTGHLFQKEIDLTNFINSSKPTFGIIDMRYFVENVTTASLLPIVTPVRQNSSSIPAVVVTRKDSGIKTLLDMKGKTFATTGKGPVNDNFLSNLIFEQQIDAAKYLVLKRVDSSNSALMAVQYKEVDIAAVDQVIFDSNLPSKSDFYVIFTTKTILYPPLCVFEKNTDQAMIDSLRTAFLKLHAAPEANDFLKPLYIDKWESVTADQYRETIKLLTTPVSQLQKEPFLAETSGSTQKVELMPPKVPVKPLPLFAVSDDFMNLIP